MQEFIKNVLNTSLEQKTTVFKKTLKKSMSEKQLNFAIELWSLKYDSSSCDIHKCECCNVHLFVKELSTLFPFQIDCTEVIYNLDAAFAAIEQKKDNAGAFKMSKEFSTLMGHVFNSLPDEELLDFMRLITRSIGALDSVRDGVRGEQIKTELDDINQKIQTYCDNATNNVA